MTGGSSGEARILVVDDDRLIREMSRDALVLEGFEVAVARSGMEALETLAAGPDYDVVITDLSMREMDGLRLTEAIKRQHPKTDVIILTAYASLESALEAMRLGAADYLRKPVTPPELVYGVKRSLLRQRLLAENQTLRGCLQAHEASRALASCLEPADVLPLAVDILERLLGGARAVGRLLSSSCYGADSVVSGFPDALANRLRAAIEQGKLFDAGDVDGRGGVREAPGEVRVPGEPADQMMVFPLRKGDQLLGGIWLFAPRERFESADQAQLELVIEQAELSLMNAERLFQARERAFIDDVTELYNARYLLAALDREVSRAVRADLPLSVLFLDLDYFKTVNDEHGHLVGSSVLRELGQLFQRSIRTIDTLARYGGDEFTIVLVETDQDDAMQIAERVRATVEEAHFTAGRGLDMTLSVSVGVATFPKHGSTREALLDQADKAMYLGKALGRNRVCSADELDPAEAAPGGRVPRGR